MSDEEKAIYDKIMAGGYGTIQRPKIMIAGDLELLKNILVAIKES